MRQLYARAALIVITLAVAVVYYLPVGHVDYLGAWREATFGLVLEPQRLDVSDVRPGSPAARAGIRPGDRIQYLQPGDYQTWARVRGPYPGERETVSLQHADGAVYRVSLQAQPQSDFDFWQRLLGVAAYLPATVFLVVAFLMVFLQPSVMTWSFYVFAIGYFGTRAPFVYFAHVLPQGPYLALTFVLIVICGSWSVLPLLPFVLRFPDGSLGAWGKRIDPYIWALLGLAFLGYVYEWFVYIRTGAYPAWDAFAEQYLPLAAFVFAAMIVIKQYAKATPSERQRWSFVVVGLVASFVAYAVYYVPGVPFEVAIVAGFPVVLMPICVAYTLFSLRVVNVNFVLNRTLVFGLLSLAVVAFVSVLDWLLARVVSEERLALGIELLVTIGIGFLLDRINRTVEGFVERIFFRARRAAESYMRRAAAALPYATDEAAIREGLLDVPVDALGLAAAALYRQSASGARFEGVGTSAHTTVAPPGFDANHLLVRMLLATEKCVWLDELRTHLDTDNAAIYVLAVPVTVRHQLVSFTLYGAHANGAQLDPEEVELLVELAREASRAYDHVEAVRVRERYAALTATQPETA